jgi:serine/threonine protein kinase
LHLLKVSFLLRGRAVGIPKLYWVGIEGDYNIIVMELLGQNLEELFKERLNKFSKKTALSLAEQIVNVLVRCSC